MVVTELLTNELLGCRAVGSCVLTGVQNHSNTDYKVLVCGVLVGYSDLSESSAIAVMRMWLLCVFLYVVTMCVSVRR